MATTPVRVMIVGDSMTQGGEGDFTWRYRLWEWLRDQGAQVRFVGPYKGTQEPDEPHPPRPPPLDQHKVPDSPIRCHGLYAKAASPDFDSHHFAVWGRQCAVTKDIIEDVVRRYTPEMLLVMLGFNDIGWFVSDAKGTLQSMKQLVTNARKANPNLRLAIANIPQRTKMEGRDDLPKSTKEYNDLLFHAVAKWTTSDSPIHLVDVCDEYTAVQASFDGLHPNNLGQYQIARAFSLTLSHDFELGQSPLSIPCTIPVRPLPSPTGFQLVSSPVGVTAVWNQVYGAFGYEFRSRIDHGDFVNEARGANRWDSHWAEDGNTYEAQVRALYGNQARSEWSKSRSAVAHPELSLPPDNIIVEATRQGVTLSWDAPKPVHGQQILQYSILWRDKDGSMFFPGIAAFKRSPAQMDELQDGHAYDICMLTWNTAGEGRPSEWQSHTISTSYS